MNRSKDVVPVYTLNVVVDRLKAAKFYPLNFNRSAFKSE